MAIILRAEQSRAEQSRAEQSRAEQSRAEQSRAEQSRAEQSRAEQSRAEQSRAEHIDNFRAFGIILMVMGHIGFGRHFDKFIHAFHMPMFFIVSGMFLSIKDEPSIFMKKKVKSLLLPYAFFWFVSLWSLDYTELARSRCRAIVTLVVHKYRRVAACRCFVVFNCIVLC